MDEKRFANLESTVATHQRILFGMDGELGLVHEHRFVWRVHVWLLCTLSGLAGSVITMLIIKWTSAWF